MADRTLPKPTRALLTALQLLERDLQRVADKTDGDAHATAYAHSLTVSTAIYRIEELAELAEDFADFIVQYEQLSEGIAALLALVQHYAGASHGAELRH